MANPGEKNDIQKSNNAHEGHRKRLRDRYLDNGINSLAEHEILELLLFYAIPRRDTKPIAKNLIETFGSLECVMNAEKEKLYACELSECAVTLLKLIPDIEKRNEREEFIGKTLKGYDEIGNAFINQFKGCKKEKIIMLLLDSRDRVIGYETVSEGGYTSAKLDRRRITELCILRSASKIALAHNHPSGSSMITLDDHTAHHAVAEIASSIEVEYLEHYIIAGDEYFGINRFIEDAKKMRLDQIMSSKMIFEDE